MRLTWAQPEDLVAHEFVALAEQGADPEQVAAVAKRWEVAGGSLQPERAGAGARPAGPELRFLARQILDELTALVPGSRDEPDDREAIVALMTVPSASATGNRARVAEEDRVAGAWWGRSAGCLLGKPVEKIPREGIEEIARATGNWPITGYFTARGLPAEVSARWPWNRRSAPTSLVENIDGMPEDDDLNFPLLVLDLLEERGAALTTADVAQAWLANLPAGRVFTAERAAYRNLLEARDPSGDGASETATHHNPFREWIGALIRADVYGWAHPGDPVAAARLAWVDARLSHTRNGLYGAMWAAALCSTALVAVSVDEVLDAGESVLPPASRLLAAVRRGRDLGRSLRTGELSDVDALDALHAEFGHLHWVHTVNNAAVIACAIGAAGGHGGFGRGVALAVAAGWDTDSAGATVGSVLGALTGLSGLDGPWVAPLHGRLATSLPGTPERSLAELTVRTRALRTRMGT
ncbi:ADP-ribosylglycohydrolase family protein [Occultella kanbiaonis]|uniref:ADP-ribosylglycohydrolase family protein n=1 Tax=Occultella kanbiaonis TaxID=2675754 RepID=UPI0013D048AF|nr:ADP-ribosylglycohydrolase family protein [Occultella kanbiaonis]